MASLPATEPAPGDVSVPDPKPARSLGPLRMIWGLALHYPRQVLFALLALLTTSLATIAIPMRFKAIIDQAFGHQLLGKPDMAQFKRLDLRLDACLLYTRRHIAEQICGR